MLNHDYKINNGRNFQFTKFSFIDFVLTDRRSFSGKRPKSASGKSSSCQFWFSAERNGNTKAIEYVTFGFSFSILVFLPFLSLNLTVCQRYGILSVLAAIIRESSDKQLVLRIVKTLTFIYQPDRGAPKAGDVSADWLYQRTWKNTIFFHVCCCSFSQGQKSLYNTAVYLINYNITIELNTRREILYPCIILYVTSCNIGLLWPWANQRAKMLISCANLSFSVSSSALTHTGPDRFFRNNDDIVIGLRGVQFGL